MAERHPDADILGLDLVPPHQSLYNNLQFQVDDIREGWVSSAPYDLVHVRLLLADVTDWPSLYSKIFE